MESNPFRFAAAKPVAQAEAPVAGRLGRWRLLWQPDSFPWLSSIILLCLIVLCFFSELWISDAGLANTTQANLAPSFAHPFGTDTLGRDIANMTLTGGKASLTVGFIAALIGTSSAIIYGCLCAMLPKRWSALLLRGCEILMSVPSILLVVFIQGILGSASVLSLGLVIGLTGWMGMSKIVYSEGTRLKASEMVQASRVMGAGFFHILRFHLLPNLLPAILFMSASSVAAAIGIESTMSFLGIGLPIETLSWGSILSLAQNSILAGRWWCFVFPSLFLAATLLCVTRIASYTQQRTDHRCSNL